MKLSKDYFYNLYYDFLMWLEDRCCDLVTIINNHRRRLDGEKQYTDKNGRRVWR